MKKSRRWKTRKDRVKQRYWYGQKKKKIPCPGSKIRSKGRGRGFGYGQGKGPIGRRYSYSQKEMDYLRGEYGVEPWELPSYEAREGIADYRRKKRKVYGKYTKPIIKKYGLIDKDEDLPWELKPHDSRESRIIEQRGMIKRLDDFKDWAKKKNLKKTDEIIEFDGMNGFGVRGFDIVSGPSVDWKTTVGDYVKDQKEEIKGRDKIIKNVESKEMDASAYRLGKSNLFKKD